MNHRAQALKALIFFVRLPYFIHIINCLCSENCPEDTININIITSKK